MILVIHSGELHLTMLKRIAELIGSEEIKFIRPEMLDKSQVESANKIFIELAALPKGLSFLARFLPESQTVTGFTVVEDGIWRTSGFKIMEWKKHQPLTHQLGQNFIVASKNMKQILKNAEQLARSNSSVLIFGETGTGKELMAEYIFRHSKRWQEEFIKINCATIPHSLFEAELFGYRKGAFTGALRDNPGKFLAADRGTIFLDEVGEIPLESQAKLLRVLDYGLIEPLGGVQPQKVDVRIIAATNKKLSDKISDGSFRQDLFYRLGVFQVFIPPLRERPEDILELFRYYLKHYGEVLQKTIRIDNEFKLNETLLGYAWPGNIRELKSLVENLLLLNDKQIIGYRDVQKLLNENKMDGKGESTLKSARMRAEKEKIIASLLVHDYHISRVADALGLSRVQLYRKMKFYGIENRKRKNAKN